MGCAAPAPPGLEGEDALPRARPVPPPRSHPRGDVGRGALLGSGVSMVDTMMGAPVRRATLGQGECSTWRLWPAGGSMGGSAGTPGLRSSWGLPRGLGRGDAAELCSRFSSSMGTVEAVE